MIFQKGPDPKRLLEEQRAFEEAERRRAEARARALFDHFVEFNPVAIEIFDTTGNIMKSNRAAERLLGKPAPEGINLFAPEGLKRTGLLEPQLKRILAGSRVETPPYWYHPGAPQKRVYIRTTAFPLLDAEGAVRSIAVVYEDLTELKKLEDDLADLKSRSFSLPPEGAGGPSTPATPADARDVEFARRKLEQALRESEERYRTLVDSVQAGGCILRLNEDGRVLAISPAVEELFGVSRAAVMLDSSLLFARVHPEDRDRVQRTESEFRTTGVYPPDYHYRVVKQTGAVTWVKVLGRVATFAHRRTFEILFIDITREKQLAELLEKKTADLNRLLESAEDGFFALDREWRITAWSRGAEKETRVSAQEAKGRHLPELYPEIETSGMAEVFRRALLDRLPQHKEFFYSDTRDRLTGWFALSVYPSETGALALIRNITARKKVEEAWNDTLARLQAILNNPLVLITFKDRSGRYVYANDTARKLFAAGAEIAGKTDAEIFSATVTALLGSYDRQVLETGKTAALEFALGDPRQKTTPWVALTKQPWQNHRGEILGIVDIGFDITRRVQAQQELLRRQEYLKKLLAELEQEFQRWR